VASYDTQPVRPACHKWRLAVSQGDVEAVAVLLSNPNLGIAIGGIGAGWIAGRFGPAVPLLGGIAIGIVATLAMLAGASVLPLAIACGAMVGIAAGAIGVHLYVVMAGVLFVLAAVPAIKCAQRERVSLHR
jgi:MFS family permease